MGIITEPLGRREFMKLLGVAVASVSAANLIGCGESAGADTIIYAQGADPRALDPAYFDDGESAKPACNIYEGLYQYGDKDTVVAPCLASALPTIMDDGLIYS
ncbi:MAG: ABC transporter substrate-binding protein, partial [Coriobacteriales bacterium]|nr:ABC transporter substrate-binding protein [Coriobacteriales bacterium]